MIDRGMGRRLFQLFRQVVIRVSTCMVTENRKGGWLKRYCADRICYRIGN